MERTASKNQKTPLFGFSPVKSVIFRGVSMFMCNHLTV